MATRDIKDLINAPIVPYDMWKQLNVPEDLLNQAQLAQQANMDHSINALVGAGQIHQFPPNGPFSGAMTTSPTPALASRARELFLKRMGGIRNELRIADGDFLQCHVYGEMVHLFYCFGGRAGVTQESIDLFPSDMLITQFRMVLST
jgi:hypothetical protein